MKSSLKVFQKLWRLSPEKKPSESPNGYYQAIQLVPDLADTHHELATNLKQQGKLAEAIAHYRQAIELHAASSSKVLPGELVGQKGGDKEDKADNSDELTAVIASSTPSLPPAKTESNQAVQVYLQQAEGYYNQKQWDQVIEACQAALAVNPHLCAAYKLWGNVVQAQGQDLEAMGYYGKALEIEPDSAPVHVNLGNLYAKQQQWEQAIKYYRQALEFDHELAIAHRNLAKILTKVGETEEAAKSRYQALSLEPEKASAQDHFQLGQQLWQLGWLREATDCYRRAVRLQPDWVEAYEQLADSLIRQGEVKEGKTYAEKAKQLSSETTSQALTLSQKGSTGIANSSTVTVASSNQTPTIIPGQWANPTVEQVQGVLQQAQQALSQAQGAVQKAQQAISHLQKPNGTVKAKSNGQLPMAQNPPTPPANPQPTLLPSKANATIEAYLKQAMVKPESAEIQADLGSLYTQEGNWDQAIAYYRKALVLDPNLGRVYRNLAKVYTQVGKEVEATEAWYQALKLEPKAVDAKQHLRVGNSLFEQGKVEQALICWQQAIRLQPDLSSAYHRLGDVLVKQGQVDRGIAVYRQSIAKNPSDFESYYQLGEIYAAQENWQGAVDCYRQVIKLRPNFAQAYHRLGEILLQLNQLDDAEKFFRKAIELE